MTFGREEKVPQIRLTAVQYGILGVFLVLAFGLWRLQVVGTDYYSQLAEKNRIRNVPILAPRGKILDREGRILVDNYPSFSALLLRDQPRDLQKDVAAIADGLHMDPAEVSDRIRKFASTPQYQPIFLKDDITPDEARLHRVTPQRATRTGHDHGAPPPLSAQRFYGAPDRIRG